MDDDVPEIIVRLEEAKPEDVIVEDVRRLMQVFHDLNQQKSPHAERARVLLRKFGSRFSPEELRIK